MKENGWQRWTSLAIAALAAFIIVPPFLSFHPPDRRPVVSINTLNGLAQAIEAFEAEYENPPNTPSLDFETEGPQAAELVTVLLGKEDPASNMQNHHQLSFLIIQISKNKKRGGLVFSPDNKVEGIYDAWGNPLRVILRPPGQATMTFQQSGKQVTISRPVVVMSKGADGKWDTKDDLISGTQKR